MSEQYSVEAHNAYIREVERCLLRNKERSEEIARKMKEHLREEVRENQHRLDMLFGKRP